MKNRVPMLVCIFAIYSFSSLAQVNSDTTRNSRRPSQDSTLIIQREQWERRGESQPSPKPSGDQQSGKQSPTRLGNRYASDARHSVRFGLGVQLGRPLGQFQQATPDITPWGMSANFLIRVERSPIWLGAEAGFLGYGRQAELVTFLSGFTGRIERRNRMVVGNLLLRLMPEMRSPIRPYLDGMVGLKYFRTATEIWNGQRRWNGRNWEENSFTVANQQSVALSYGGALGVNIRLGGHVFVDLKGMYLLGGTAEYVVPGSVRADPADPSRTLFDSRRSATDMFLSQVAVAFAF